MADTTLSPTGLVQIEVGASENTWGDKTNDNMTVLNTLLTGQANGTPKTSVYTVATLPSAATRGAGARAYVTDSNSFTFGIVVAAGGAGTVPVYSDGAAWRIG